MNNSQQQDDVKQNRYFGKTLEHNILKQDLLVILPNEVSNSQMSLVYQTVLFVVVQSNYITYGQDLE